MIVNRTSATSINRDGRHGTTRRRLQKGAAVAEMAIALPLLSLILLGTVDFGRIMHDTIIVQSAARAGAHHGARSKAAAADGHQIELVVLDELREFREAKYVDVESEYYCTCNDGKRADCDTGSCGGVDPRPWPYVHVAVGTTFEPLFGYPGIPEQVRLVRQAHMRVVQ